MHKIKITIVLFVLFCINSSCKKDSLKEKYSGSYFCNCITEDGFEYSEELIFKPSNDNKDNLLYTHFYIDNNIRVVYRYTYLYLNEDGSFKDNNPNEYLVGNFTSDEVTMENMLHCNCIKK